jgi:hypothetical protein
MQPAAFGCLEPDPVLRASRQQMQRQIRLETTQVPQRRVDGGEREGGDGANRGRMREKEKLFPELLDLGGVSSNGRAAPTAAPL